MKGAGGLCVVGLVLLPAVAGAQHPCEAPPITSAIHDAGVVPLGWCHTESDIPTWKLYVNGVPLTLTNVTTDGTRAPTGELFYTATVTFNRGRFWLQVTAVNSVGESERSAPILLRTRQAS